MESPLNPVMINGRRIAAFVSLILVGTAAPAQEVIEFTEELGRDRPEAWAMNYFTSVTILAGLSVPRTREPGAIDIGVELGGIPHLSKGERTVGFEGTKEEDLNKAPFFGRPRVTVGLPNRFALTAAYLPPVRIFGLKPWLITVGLERPLYESDPVTIGWRAYGQVGKVEGAITCFSDFLEHPPGSEGNPFGCEEKSSDKATQRYVGMELSGSYRIAALGGLKPWAAIGGQFMDNAVRVNSLIFGIRDRTRLEAETWTWSVSAGAEYPVTDKLSLSLGVFYSPLTVVRVPGAASENDSLFNARALLSYRFR